MEASTNGDSVVNAPGGIIADGIVPQVQPVAGISADEIALYDRQIRLWGVQAQEKIRNANILLISMKALANEIAKNLVLAGIGSLTVIDHEIVTEADLGAQFFISDENVGQNRAEAAAPQIHKLNPRVNVIVDIEDIRVKSASYYAAFDVIIATDLDPDALNIINLATRLNHKPFYAAGVHGFYGFIFSDLIQHEYVIQRDKSNKDTALGVETRTRSVIDTKTKKEGGKNIEMVTKREVYSTWELANAATLPDGYLKSKRRLRAVTPLLSCFRALWEFVEGNQRLPGHTGQDLGLFTRLATQKHNALSLPTETLRSNVLRSFIQNLGSEIAPVTALIGGQLAQDVINVLGKRQQPIQNMVIYDGESMDAPMYALHPEGALGEGLLPISGAAAIVDTSTMANGGIDYNSGMNGQVPPMDMSNTIEIV